MTTPRPEPTRPVAYSAVPEPDPATVAYGAARGHSPTSTTAFGEPASHASTAPTPPWLTPESPLDAGRDEYLGEREPVVRPGLFVGHPGSFAAGVAVTAVAVGLTVWLTVYCANSVLAQIDPTSVWSRLPLPVGEAVGWSVAGVLAAAGLLLGLMATVEPPRTYYRWMVVLLTGVVMATVYTATGTIHWQHAIAPLVVVLVAATATSVGIGLVGSDRALRTVNQRTPIRSPQRWQDHR
ncbi:hypothetical protein O4158_21030 [Gordonia amicalis]|uniref:hypothetical protein n=1 Tax=Gordonia amicalis TaxID=89053 RepID=UPI0022B54E3A|nr:hypothetical protein [Gordonia amicalis]MCZ4581524.1 hypothetical protein [Gordonia amicalis]